MSIHTGKLVSVYIPTRNRAKQLQQALQSVLDQTWENIEIIVVDDASEDHTPEILENIAETHPIKIIRNKSPKGAAISRNVALEHASGDFVAGIDDDDLWMPKRIEYLIQAFHEGYSAVCSHDRMDYGTRKMIWKKKPLISLDDLLFYNRVGNQVLTKREYLLEAGGYDETLPSAQDYDLWIRLTEAYGPVKNVPHVLQVVNARQNRSSITTSERSLDGYLACFEKHKSKMSLEQQNYQRYRIKLDSGDRVAWPEMFRMVPLNLWTKEIKRKIFIKRNVDL